MKKLRFTLNLSRSFLLLTSGLSCQLVYAQSVSGHIEIEAGAPVKRVIVYLKSDKSNPQNQTHQISQKDTHFNPPLTIITSGDKVEWVNDEAKDIDHNIYSLNETNAFDLGLGAKGSKLDHPFNQIGEVNYYCSVHKNMEGKIVVLPSHYYQVLEQPGNFKIDGVPEGKWQLNAVVLHRRYKVEPVNVTIAKTALQNLTLKLVKR
jgi:plastocyanin